MPPDRATRRDLWPPVAAALVIGGACGMIPHGRLHDLGTVPWFLGWAGVMLAGFYLALRYPPRSAWMFWAVAAGARLVLLFQAPGADIYRYLWEGRILLAGWNPYLHAPDASVLEPLRDGWWASVQHKAFSAIYPPLAQWVMGALALVAGGPWGFKAAFALADLAVAALLARRFGRVKALVYAWNPLVVYSFAGGGHYDSIFVLALVLGWFGWSDGNRVRAVVWLGAAVALKWLALPLWAWAWWRMLVEARKTGRWGGAVCAGLAGALPMAVAYCALCLWTGEWTAQLHPAKFSQFARSAELVPWITGLVWEESRYHNQWFAIPLAVGWAWVILLGRDIERTAEWLTFLALVLTPMLHAWYFTWMVPFAVATRNRGAIAVSGSAFVYFLLYHSVESGEGWALKPHEVALLWLPFVAGFLWSARGLAGGRTGVPG